LHLVNSMYCQVASGQLSFENFYLPFGGKLSGDNRWVKLAQMIPWEEFEEAYASQFDHNLGAPAKSFRLALGALIIKERLGTSDVETVEQIRENPYLQYFLGFHEYREEAPFEASMLTHFRHRLGVQLVATVNEAVVSSYLEPSTAETESASHPLSSPSEEASAPEDSDEPPDPPNQGHLLIDASCAPADIGYPTDWSLLNQARRHSEVILDALFEQVRQPGMKKPRTYRRLARRSYLAIAKQRRPSRAQRRKAIGAQLRYLQRNLGHIDRLIEAGASLARLSRRHYRLLLVIHELARQQWSMYRQRQHRIEHRIVSLAQPHVRPIVRGKAGTPVEFGAKFSLSCIQGFSFVEHISWEAFNESADLQQQVEQFKARCGHYPAVVCADQIYRTRANRSWCAERNIRLSGPPLGRPSAAAKAEHATQTREDAARRNAIEGKFGQAKRRFGLARIMAKLAPTAETCIALTFLVMNLERLLRRLLFVVLLADTFAGSFCKRRTQCRPLTSHFQPILMAV